MRDYILSYAISGNLATSTSHASHYSSVAEVKNTACPFSYLFKNALVKNISKNSTKTLLSTLISFSMVNWRVSWPNPAMCFILAGLAVGDYSQFVSKSHQKYAKEGIDDTIVPQDALKDRLLTASKVYTGFPYSKEYVSPWDPLSQTEMRMAALIIRAYNSSSKWQFKCIGVLEVNKTLVLPYYLSGTNPPLGHVPRIATVMIADPVKRIPICVTVNLSTMRVETWTDAKPGEKVAVITNEDYALASDIVLANPTVLQRLRALGYNDPTKIIADSWEGGYAADNPIYLQAAKLLQVFLYGVDSNFYTRPIGFIVYVDVGPRVVLGIENFPIQDDFNTNNRTGDSIPQNGAPYFPEDLPPNTIVNNLNPIITITQKDGPSYLIEGRKITWQNFQFRIGFNEREGPHFYTVTYNDNGEIRPLFYKLSISEVFLQYGDPRPPYHTKSSFDQGNFEYGTTISQLPEKQFCRGDASYFQTDRHNEKGETYVVPNSICVYEDDAGILWAHHDIPTDRTAATRSQRLSISYLATAGNLDYWISWRFYLDATVEFAVKMTGPVHTSLMAVDVKAPPYGNLLQPQIYTINYFHSFAVRIDADIDGLENVVSVEDIVTVEPSKNPYGNGIQLNATVFKTAGESPSDINPATGRFWRISNPNKIQPLSGKPSSWKLIPQGSLNDNLLAVDSPLRDRVRWTDHNTWVLPYNPSQIFAGGLFLDCGIAKWTNEAPNANIENTDVVLWHIARSFHIPDVEDWPVYSADAGLTGFRLRPSNFLKSNPAYTVPPASDTTAGDGGSENASGWGSNPNPVPAGWNALS